jgi:tRNA pseudouridine38-40 synthase
LDELRNIRLLLEYDGGAFHGWQIQEQVRTVQGVLEEALRRLLGTPHRVVAASRTDSGAHARGQVVNFFTRSELVTPRILMALNAILPEDVIVREVGEETLEFNARRSARSRRYSYRIVVGPSALWRTRAWAIRRPLDMTPMTKACSGALGLRDFRAFSVAQEENESTFCTVTECVWKEWSEGYVFEIEADRFVRYMIRTLVGTMVRIGEGRASTDEFTGAFETRVRPRLAFTAPARGLCLEVVRYDLG